MHALRDAHTHIYTQSCTAHCDNGDICSVPVVVCGWLMAHSDGLQKTDRPKLPLRVRSINPPLYIHHTLSHTLASLPSITSPCKFNSLITSVLERFDWSLFLLCSPIYPSLICSFLHFLLPAAGRSPPPSPSPSPPPLLLSILTFLLFAYLFPFPFYLFFFLSVFLSAPPLFSVLFLHCISLCHPSCCGSNSVKFQAAMLFLIHTNAQLIKKYVGAIAKNFEPVVA